MDEWIDRGRAAVERWRDDQRLRAVQRLPLVQVRVREQVALPASAATIWSLVGDTGNDAAVVGPSHVRTFVVPGTPAGAVGELRCTVLRRPDGSWAGHLLQVVERVEGVRFAGRALSLGFRHLETVTVADGLLTWEAAVETQQPVAAQVQALVQRNVAGHVARIAAVLDGDAPAEDTVPFVTSCDDRSALVDVEVSVSADLRIPVDVAWAHVRAARSVALESADPTATSFTVPGSPQAEPGELVCVIAATSDGGRAATFQQVVGQEAGRSVVSRSLSVVAEHAWERELRVEPIPGGARVTYRVRVPVHRRQAAATRATWTADAQRYLGAIESALVAAA
ncbi:hypothetical protein [Cellulomonas xylanilytica]|nr:hypothetical protein [Cellulomonas xylanilytica]